jgi:hypothetical protein
MLIMHIFVKCYSLYNYYLNDDHITLAAFDEYGSSNNAHR